MSALAPAITSKDNIYPKVWVKLSAYCDLVGEDKEAVRSRVRRGDWLEGKHVMRKDGRTYVNLPEADKWVEKQQ